MVAIAVVVCVEYCKHGGIKRTQLQSVPVTRTINQHGLHFDEDTKGELLGNSYCNVWTTKPLRHEHHMTRAD